MGMVSPLKVEAHHLEAVRDSESDYAAIPVCAEHHRGPNGIHGLSRRGFEARYKLSPIDLLALTIRAMEQEGMIS